MKAPPKIFRTRPCEQQYYEMSELDWFPSHNMNQPHISPETRRVTDVVSVDMRHDDLKYLLNLDHWHRARSRDPRVHDAWQQYVMMLHLTGESGIPE